MRIRPPDLQDEDYRRIYLAWLGYATHGLNPHPGPNSIDPDPRYEALSQGSEVIKVLNICPEKSQKKTCTVSLALPPQGAKSVAKFLESYPDMQNEINKVQTELPRTGGTPESDDSSQASEEAEITLDPCEQKADEQNGIPSLLKYYSNAKQVYAILPYIATSLASLKSYQSASQRSQQTQKRYQSTSKNSQQAQEPPPESPPDSFSHYFMNVDNLSSAEQLPS